MAERLQKWLAGLGLGSRRHLETLIAAGRVTVNGEVAKLGSKVTGRERILVDGKPVRLPAPDQTPAHRLIVYHKPAGEIVTRSDPEGRPTVFDGLPRLKRTRWISVGRLDVQTSGLMLFTTDGELAHRLMHPSAGLKREYAVRVQGQVSDEQLDRLRGGIELDDGRAHFDRVERSGGQGANQWFSVVVSEGRNRLVRRVWEAVGCRVSRLIRVRFGPAELPRQLRAGKYQDVPPKLQQQLYRAAGLSVTARQDSGR